MAWAMSVLVNAKSNCHRKTRHVESGGTGLLRSRTLPGEVSSVRAPEKSAEAIVARKPLKGGGAKGRRTGNATMDKLAKKAHEGDATTETAGTTCWAGGPVAAKHWMCGAKTGVNHSFRSGE
jgi:hypothetical protein